MIPEPLLALLAYVVLANLGPVHLFKITYHCSTLL